MDNLDVILYIVFGIIWLVARLLKGKDKKQREFSSGEGTAEASGTSQPKPKKQLTFEDILRQLGDFDEETDVQETPVVKEPAVQKPVAKAVSPYEEYNQASNLEERARQNSELHSVMDEGDAVKFEDYKVKKSKNKYAKLLKSKDGIKNAIILSEIINRKY